MITLKEARKALRDLKKNEEVRRNVIRIGKNQIQCLMGKFAVCGGVDDSNPYTDYCAWTFGWSEKEVLDMLKRENAIVC